MSVLSIQQNRSPLVPFATNALAVLGTSANWWPHSASMRAAEVLRLVSFNAAVH